MTTTTDRFGTTVLAAHESLELLRSSVVGRLAVSITDHPDIFPINYVVDHGCVVFRTAEGTKLAAAMLGRGVAFEVDGYDQANGEAWSVVIKGHAVEIEKIHDLFDAVELPLFSWQAAPKPRFVRIEPVDISGRRFSVVEDARPCAPNDSATPGTAGARRPTRPIVARRGSTGELHRPATGPKSDRAVADRTADDGPEHATAAVAVGTVTLSWIPLGAGHHVVRASGKVFEALCAAVQRRHTQPLYHSALEISVPAGRFTIEMAPIPDTNGQSRGVVAEAPVGMRWAGRFRVFRYEIRRWRDGVIPDAELATSTVVVGVDVAGVERLLELVPLVPTAVWGRDELDAGEMWNSNSVTSWLLARGGFDTSHLSPPSGGRAPGWRAGLIVALVPWPTGLTRRPPASLARTGGQRRSAAPDGARGTRSRSGRTSPQMRRRPSVSGRGMRSHGFSPPRCTARCGGSTSKAASDSHSGVPPSWPRTTSRSSTRSC